MVGSSVGVPVGKSSLKVAMGGRCWEAAVDSLPWRSCCREMAVDISQRKFALKRSLLGKVALIQTTCYDNTAVATI